MKQLRVWPFFWLLPAKRDGGVSSRCAVVAVGCGVAVTVVRCILCAALVSGSRVASRPAIRVGLGLGALVSGCGGDVGGVGKDLADVARVCVSGNSSCVCVCAC